MLKNNWDALFKLITQCNLYGCMTLIIYIGADLYEKDKITIGTITAFFLYMTLLITNFMMFFWVLGNVATLMGTADKVIRIFHYKPKINTEGGLKIEDDQDVQGRIELKNVKFTYPTKKEVQVLKGITLEVENSKNRVVALCGTSGCGKSSIISMIERFYDPEEGQVLFNGVDIKDIDPRWYHEQVSIVQQEPVLFSGTIRENILYGLSVDGLTEEQIIAKMDEACLSANAAEFIKDEKHFPLGYETIVGERGVRLSGG